MPSQGVPSGGQYSSWEESLQEEVAFWRTCINDPDGPWEKDLRVRLDPTTSVQDWIKQLVHPDPGETVRLLDVGAGPATDLGKVWPQRKVVIVAVDPLANEYNQLLDEARIIPPVRTRYCHGEKLREQFGPDTFDLVYARNALDHSYDPLSIIQQMLEIVKPDHWVRLVHFVNEAEFEHYQGLHQWNFCEEDGEFVVWNAREHMVVRKHLPMASEMRVSLAAGRVENGRLQVLIRKREAAR